MEHLNKALIAMFSAVVMSCSTSHERHQNNIEIFQTNTDFHQDQCSSLAEKMRDRAMKMQHDSDGTWMKDVLIYFGMQDGDYIPYEQDEILLLYKTKIQQRFEEQMCGIGKEDIFNAAQNVEKLNIQLKNKYLFMVFKNDRLSQEQQNRYFDTSYELSDAFRHYKYEISEKNPQWIEKYYPDELLFKIVSRYMSISDEDLLDNERLQGHIRSAVFRNKERLIDQLWNNDIVVAFDAHIDEKVRAMEDVERAIMYTVGAASMAYLHDRAETTKNEHKNIPFDRENGI